MTPVMGAVVTGSGWRTDSWGADMPWSLSWTLSYTGADPRGVEQRHRAACEVSTAIRGAHATLSMRLRLVIYPDFAEMRIRDAYG